MKNSSVFKYAVLFLIACMSIVQMSDAIEHKQNRAETSVLEKSVEEKSGIEQFVVSNLDPCIALLSSLAVTVFGFEAMIACGLSGRRAVVFGGYLLIMTAFMMTTKLFFSATMRYAIDLGFNIGWVCALIKHLRLAHPALVEFAQAAAAHAQGAVQGGNIMNQMINPLPMNAAANAGG